MTISLLCIKIKCKYSFNRYLRAIYYKAFAIIYHVVPYATSTITSPKTQGFTYSFILLKLLPDAAVIFQPYEPDVAAFLICKTLPSVTPAVSVGNVKVLFVDNDAVDITRIIHAQQL